MNVDFVEIGSNTYVVAKELGWLKGRGVYGREVLGLDGQIRIAIRNPEETTWRFPKADDWNPSR